MKISVIIITYNRVEDTVQLLECLRKQTFNEFEIILIDNNSTDKTQEILSKYFHNIKYIRIPYNAGVPGGRNIGIANAIGDYLVFIDNDVEINPDFLKMVNSTFKKEPKAGILAFRIINYYSKNLDMTTWVWDTSFLKNEEFKPVHKFVGAGFAIRRDIVNQVGLLWDDLFFMHEEKDYSMRLLRTDFLIYYTPNIEVQHKVSPEKRYESKERSFFYGIRNEFWIYIRNAPFMVAAKHLSYLFLTALLYSIKKKSFGNFCKGVTQGIFFSKRAWKYRRPLSPAQFRQYHDLFNKDKDSLMDKIKRYFS